MELLYFILGILFMQYIIPLLEGLCTWFLIWIETKKNKLINFNEEEVPKKPIGFDINKQQDKTSQ